MEENLKTELRRLSSNAAVKRDRLIETALRQTRRRKRLNIAAGVLALLSAATFTSLLADLTPALWVKVFAALSSTASGLISLLSNSSYKDGEILELHSGAARYLSLRERANRISLNPGLDAQQLFKALEEVQETYSNLDEQYQRYILEYHSEHSGTGDGGHPPPVHKQWHGKRHPVRSMSKKPGESPPRD